MRMIKEKTYNRYMRRITRLMALNPRPGTPKGKELLRLAKAAEHYEKAHWPLNHSKRKLRADLVDR